MRDRVVERTGRRRWTWMEFLSCEWLLTRTSFANGGGIVLLRTLLTSIYMYFFALLMMNVIDPQRTWAFSFSELRVQMLETLQWFGAIFTATYFAFYTRFASQWTYLAELYNQIKCTEVSTDCDGDALAEWKAGFAEDADVLHLATKPLIASILKSWLNEEKVKGYFVRNAPRGEQRFELLRARVLAAFESEAK